MAVTQKIDGRWCVVHRENGKQRWKYFGRGLEAKQAAVEYDDGLKDAGKVRQYKKRSRKIGATFTELTAAYLTAKSSTLPRVSLQKLTLKLTAVILPMLGHRKAGRLSYSDMDNFVLARSKKVKFSTIRRELTIINAILNWSVRRKLILSNPIIGYRKPADDDAVIRPPTTAEVKALIRHASPHVKRVIRLTFFTGIRPGNSELFALTWDDVDIENNSIHIVSALKGGLKERFVPIHQDLLPHLIKWHRQDDGTGSLIHYRGKPLSTIKKAWELTKKRAGISRRLRPYDLRHCFASMMLSAGGDLKNTSELLGHATPALTVKTYQHVTRSMHETNIAKLPGLD